MLKSILVWHGGSNTVGLASIKQDVWLLCVFLWITIRVVSLKVVVCLPC